MAISRNNQGKAIKRALRTSGMSQGEFSRRLGISPAHVSRVINGTRRLSFKHMLDVSRMLGISLETLLS